MAYDDTKHIRKYQLLPILSLVFGLFVTHVLWADSSSNPNLTKDTNLIATDTIAKQIIKEKKTTAQLTLAQKQLQQLELSVKGHLGVSAIDTGNNERIDYRDHERFPMGCTSKVIGVAAILKQSENQPKLLSEKIFYQKHELQSWSPITAKHLMDGMTVSALSAAAISYSDNTAMDLLAKKLGGLAKINQFAVSIGDQQFRLNHDWPKEAEAGPDGKMDSTTPYAMAQSLQRLTLGDALAQPQRQMLVTWMKATTTGDHRIRAGLPKNWQVGDKTGTGFNYGITNDMAVVWPPHHAPIVMVIYFNQSQKNAPERDDVLAKAAKIIASNFIKD